jgi:hypothetical protein
LVIDSGAHYWGELDIIQFFGSEHPTFWSVAIKTRPTYTTRRLLHAITILILIIVYYRWYVLYARWVTIGFRQRAHPIESKKFHLFAYAKFINCRLIYIYLLTSLVIESVFYLYCLQMTVSDTTCRNHNSWFSKYTIYVNFR